MLRLQRNAPNFQVCNCSFYSPLETILPRVNRKFCFRFTKPILLGLTILLIISSGCATIHYDRVRNGALKGKLLVEWVEPDLFIFTPDKQNPLTFDRFNNERITPQKMYTDGGSIPRPLWALRNYSPWGYAPAFMIHDWLFVVKQCAYEGRERYTLETAGLVMSEVMKTMMMDPRWGNEDKLTLYAMYEAVTSPIARSVWEKGQCNQPEAGKPPLEGLKPSVSYIIEFP